MPLRLQLSTVDARQSAGGILQACTIATMQRELISTGSLESFSLLSSSDAVNDSADLRTVFSPSPDNKSNNRLRAPSLVVLFFLFLSFTASLPLPLSVSVQLRPGIVMEWTGISHREIAILMETQARFSRPRVENVDATIFRRIVNILLCIRCEK